MRGLHSALVLAATVLLHPGLGAGPAEASPPAASLTVSYPGAYGQPGTLRVRAPASPGAPDLTLRDDLCFQAIDGFGGAFNEQGWDALSVLDEGQREEALRLLFSSQEAARFRFGRIPIGASDYAISRYTLDDQPGDYALDHFSIERDRLLLIPYLQAALAYQPGLWLWGSAWTPPPWMKMNGAYDSGSMRGDAPTLDAYARYLARFVESYRDEGLRIRAVHVQNEPEMETHYPSCAWTPELIRDFVRDHLGPRFAERGLGAEVWLGTLNTSNPRYPLVVLGDPGARSVVRGIGVQWGALDMVPELVAIQPPLPLMQTETPCGNHHWEPGFDPDRPHNDQAYGEYTWGRIRAYLEAGVRSYMAWNMVLDLEGKNLDSQRPWPQNALLVVDREQRRLRVTPAYWAFRHFSAFIDAGAVRVGLRGTYDDALAFRNPDGGLVLVLQNATNRARTLTIGVPDAELDLDLPAHGWATVTY